MRSRSANKKAKKPNPENASLQPPNPQPDPPKNGNVALKKTFELLKTILN